MKVHKTHLQDPGDVAGPRAAVGELDDLLPRGVRQRPAVHEHAAQLVHAAVTYTWRHTHGSQVTGSHNQTITIITSTLNPWIDLLFKKNKEFSCKKDEK